MSGPTVRTKSRTSTLAHARAREVDVFVVDIARAIVDGRWGPGSDLAYAAEKGVQPGTVREWSAEAMRMLRVGHDVDTYRSVNLVRLDEVYSTSVLDPKARVSAVAEQNRMLGLHAPTKVDVTVQAYAGLDGPAMVAKVDEQIAKLTELRERLLEQQAVTVPALPAESETDDE